MAPRGRIEKEELLLPGKTSEYLLIDPEYADMMIECEGKQFPAHCCLVCPWSSIFAPGADEKEVRASPSPALHYVQRRLRAPQGSNKSTTRVIKLDDVLGGPRVIKAFLDFIYLGWYTMESTQLEGPCSKDPTVFEEGVLHMHVFIFAERLKIPQLVAEAQEGILDTIKNTYYDDDVRLLRFLFQQIPRQVSGELRKAVLQAMAIYAHNLFETPERELHKLIEETPEVAAEWCPLLAARIL